MILRSISRRLIAAVLILELISALSLIAITALHESRVRFRAFDVTLYSRANFLIGAVGDPPNDDADNLTLDASAVRIPAGNIFEIRDDDTGRIIGKSDQAPTDILRAAEVSKDAIFKFRLNGINYRLVRTHAVRTVDADKQGGGVVHHVTALYAGPIQRVMKDVRDTVRFYTLVSFALLAATGCGMAWFLRRELSPLRELAAEAAGVTTRQWKFMPPDSARATRELAPLTQAIETTLARLQESFQQQERFTSDAAHELKTGVAIAKSSLQLLAMRTRSTEEYKRGLEVCLKDCLRLENIVQEMLALARVERSHDDDPGSRTRVLDFATCARDGVEKLASFAKLRGVGISLAVTDCARVRLTAEEGDTLCSNLLLNALQHSGASTEVRVEISGDKNWTTMSIEDHGDGIGAEALPHIFEPFFRGDPSRARHSGGSGLGLSICKAICDRAGGSIEVKSTVGTGTRVVVRIPAAGHHTEVPKISTVPSGSLVTSRL